jgi:bifunctional non-homologous end joining protein LigD
MNDSKLPRSIRPMLAKPGAPFDSAQYLFEVKWDGMRALAYVDAGGYRIVSRHGNDITDRFPELGSLADLPTGTVLDGELVVLRDGKPSFSLLQTRAPLCCAHRIDVLSRTTPATFIVFDQLFDHYRSLIDEPLSARREVMLETVHGANTSRLAAPGGVVGAGRSFYEHVVQARLEGVVAKRLASRYLPGRRTGAWIKIKPGRMAGPH